MHCYQLFARKEIEILHPISQFPTECRIVERADLQYPIEDIAPMATQKIAATLRDLRQHSRHNRDQRGESNGRTLFARGQRRSANNGNAERPSLCRSISFPPLVNLSTGKSDRGPPSVMPSNDPPWTDHRRRTARNDKPKNLALSTISTSFSKIAC